MALVKSFAAQIRARAAILFKRKLESFVDLHEIARVSIVNAVHAFDWRVLQLLLLDEFFAHAGPDHLKRGQAAS